MSIQNDQIQQMYKALLAMREMLFEAHGGCSEARQAVEYQMSQLDELFKPVEITSDMVKELRKQTGEGMMCCLKALRQARGNLTFAADIMRSGSSLRMNDSHWGNQ